MAQRRTQQGTNVGRGAQVDARVAAVLSRHSGALMRVARQWSLCHDDALDAFQRGLEIFVRRMDAVDPATEAAWLKVVIRHEAMAIRRSRSDCVADPNLDLDLVLPAAQRSVEEQVLSGDRVSRSAEALRALKPDEARALMLKAHGLSYDEIARHCGWTYTKVNRAITEGRRRFMEVYAALEEGTECERFAPVLRALAAGTATSEQLLEIRPHLRRCVACRATVRDLHRSRLPILLPLPALAASLGWLRERFGGGRVPPEITDVLGPDGTTAVDVPDLMGPHGSPDVDTPDLVGPHGPPDLAAPDAREVIQQAQIEDRLDRLRQVKDQAVSLAHRTNSSDLAAGIHIAATSGGGRIATLGAIVGLCVSGIGAGTVCIVTGVLDGPLGLGSERHHPIVKRHSRPSLPRRSGRSISSELASARLAPTPTPTPRPAPHVVQRPRRVVAKATPAPASVDPSQGTAPTSQEHAPISPAPAQPAAQEFAAAPTGGHAPPAPPPATGGAEFGP